MSREVFILIRTPSRHRSVDLCRTHSAQLLGLAISPPALFRRLRRNRRGAPHPDEADRGRSNDAHGRAWYMSCTYNKMKTVSYWNSSTALEVPAEEHPPRPTTGWLQMFERTSELAEETSPGRAESKLTQTSGRAGTRRSSQELLATWPIVMLSTPTTCCPESRNANTLPLTNQSRGEHRALDKASRRRFIPLTILSRRCHPTGGGSLAPPPFTPPQGSQTLKPPPGVSSLIFSAKRFQFRSQFRSCSSSCCWRNFAQAAH